MSVVSSVLVICSCARPRAASAASSCGSVAADIGNRPASAAPACDPVSTRNPS